jgi:hypothetical protein
MLLSSLRVRLSFSALLAVLLWGVGCPQPLVNNNPDAGTGDVTALHAKPDHLALDPGASASVVVTGSDARGTSVDVGDLLSFSSGDEAVARVDGTGVVTGIAGGHTTVRARAGVLTVDVDVLVSNGDAPLTLSYDTPVVYKAGLAIAPNTPTATGGLITSYSVVPALPAGLVLDVTSGVLSGTPNAPTALTTFTITGANGAGSVIARVDIEVDCDPSVAPPQDADRPDAQFVDANHDGIDGMACGPIFVSTHGDDANDGSKEHPKKTLGAALARASALTPVRDVYVAAGSYSTSLELSDGVSIYGGYNDATWSRATSNVTTIVGGSVAVRAENLTRSVELGLLQITAADAFFVGDSSIGVLARNNTGTLKLTGCVVQAGRGANGAAGAPGDNGDKGDDGEGGDIGCEADTTLCSNPTCLDPRSAGFGAFSVLIGGSGGDGGSPGLGAQGGHAGAPGEAGAAGGGAGSTSSRDGRNGTRGRDGTAGHNGTGGAHDADGFAGSDGSDGTGGGGGGGGAGAPHTLCDDFGGAGGGGASAGSGGTAGTGGTHGGGSYALVVVAATVDTSGAQLVAGAGGTGGDGGRGGTAGAGGVGGPGGQGADSSGHGGAGGGGGNGGIGGHGGGGGGGSSAAVLTDDVAHVIGTSSKLPGTAGTGGRGPGTPGQLGARAEVLVGGLAQEPGAR